MIGIVGGFGLGGQDVADGLEQPAVVVAVDPFERGVLDGLKRSPWPVPPDDLSLLEAVGRLSQGVVVTVADAADGGFEARFGEAFGVLDGDVLRSPVAVMHEPAADKRPTIAQRLLKSIENEARVRRA